MKRADFLKMLDEVLEVDPGTIKGDENLADLPKWDSLAVLGFIAAVDTNFRIQVSVVDLTSCKTVSDLEVLLAGRISP